MCSQFMFVCCLFFFFYFVVSNWLMESLIQFFFFPSECVCIVKLKLYFTLSLELSTVNDTKEANSVVQVNKLLTYCVVS